MINISGHLRNIRKATGFSDSDNPVIVNCCGKQVFKTKNYQHERPNGRLDYQIIYIYEGSGHFFLNDQWTTLSAGNIILYRPEEPQHYAYYADDKPEIYWIHFTGTDCEHLLKKYAIQNCYIGENNSLKLLFQDIITELQLKKTVFDDIVINDFLKILAIICRSHQQLLTPSENNFSIDRLIIQLNQRYMDDWTVTSMADYCKLSESYFAHTFKNRMQISPMRFLNELRIEKAKELLSSNNMSIATAASLVGFEDPLYFSRVFKKMTGIAPQNFFNITASHNTPEWFKDNPISPCGV